MSASTCRAGMPFRRRSGARSGGARPPRAAAAGLLVALLALACSCGEAPSPGPPPRARPSVLLLVVDTLRADRLGAYGCSLETSPALDRLAGRGVLLEDVTVQWPRTLPSMASFLSGTYPRSNGIRARTRVLPPELAMLSEVFREAGYRTGAVVANWNVSSALGFSQGFDHFEESWAERWERDHPGRGLANVPVKLARDYTDATVVNAQALKWLRELPRDEPFFLWLHYLDPHGPYLAPPEVATLFQGAHPSQPVAPGLLPPYQVQRDPATGEAIGDLGFYKAQYDRMIRHVDRQVDLLLETIGRERLAEDLLILFTSDHGESLDEHGYYLDHGRFSYQATARVPAIFVREGILPAGARVSEPVGLIDLSATLLELAGLEVPATFQGESVRGLVAGGEGTAPAHVFMESGRREDKPQRTVRRGRWKLIEVLLETDRLAMAGSRFELYDVEADPGERVNLAGEHPAIVETLAGVLEAWHTGGPLPDPPREVDLESLDQETREMLRSLGYIE